MSETNSLPPAPEPPQWVQLWRWFVDYLTREGTVIKEAKLTFGAAALALMAASTWVTWKVSNLFFEERIASKDATIATKDATIDYLRSQAGSPREKTDPPKATEVQSSRLELSLQYIRPTSDKPLAINLLFSNKGTIPSSQPIHAHLSIYTNKVLDASEIDAYFSQLFQGAVSARAKNKTSNQIYPNQPPAFWSDFDFYDETERPVVIDEAKYKTIIDGDMRLYTFALVHYRDTFTPDKHWRTTELCVFLFKPGSAGVCDAHNITGLVE